MIRIDVRASTGRWKIALDSLGTSWKPCGYFVALLPQVLGQGITARFPVTRELKKDRWLVAVKKTATKVAKTIQKTSKTAAKKAVTKKPAVGKVTAAKAPAAKKTATAKAPAAKKAVAVKKVAATGKSTAKTASVKPAAAKKPAIANKKVTKIIDKKPAAKKAVKATKAPVAKKAAAKKAVAKEATVKKVVVKKVAVKTAAATKATAKKSVATTKPATVGKAVKKTSATAASKAATPVKSAPAVKASPAQAAAPAKRRLGKVAVAVAAKPQAPVSRGKVKVVPYKTEKGSGRPIVPKGYVPAADEEYMSPLQLEYFRQRLLQWRDDLVEESKQTIENLKDEVRDVGDEAERATRETENSLELRTRDRYRKLISKIDSTLKRVDSGDYGFCVDTGEEIGLERMDARLTAERTIDAQERWEHLRKQMGD